MFTLSFSKLLLTVARSSSSLWRGYRMLAAACSSRLSRGRAPSGSAAAPAARTATELVECPRCGTFVPNGTHLPQPRGLPVPPRA